jgi:antitoxin ParD1/3/4
MPSSFTLSPHFDAFIKEQIASGRYANASEVVRAGLRLLEEHEEGRAMRAMTRAEKLEWLAAEVQKGIDSGPGIPWEAAMEMLDDRAAKRASERSTREAA